MMKWIKRVVIGILLWVWMIGCWLAGFHQGAVVQQQADKEHFDKLLMSLQATQMKGT